MTALSLTLILALLSSFSFAQAAPLDRQASASGGTPEVRSGRWLQSTTTRSDGAAKAAADTFYLYGGPGSPEGRFQSSGLVPDRQGWIGVDRTDRPIYWQVSTFNAENLNDNGAGNQAAWCGQTAEQQPSYVAGTGYGHSWNVSLIFQSPPLTDPSVGQTVDLDFFFNHETEPGYDYFRVEYDSAGTWITVAAFDGTNKEPPVNSGGVFSTPGVQYSTQSGQPIDFIGNDYGGENGDQIVLRLRFQSDGAFDDETGLWPTDAGAVQVDDISVTWSEGSSFENFESGDFGDWWPDKQPFAGDFSRVWSHLDDAGLDRCRDNGTPVMAFVDAGQEVGNAESAALIPGYPTSTGGETSINHDYGFPGGWVVNYNGGLGGNFESPIWNEVWSPEIDWDLSGSEDDDPTFVGAQLRFDMWVHLPLVNAHFRWWAVRSSADGSYWGPWEEPSFLDDQTGPPHWETIAEDLTGMIAPGAQKIQVALGVREETISGGLPANDATPSPVYDNVAVLKYDVGGVRLSAIEDDLAQDGFPVSGAIDVSSAAARDQLDIPFDMARDVAFNENPNVDPGDSLVIAAEAVIPDTWIADVRMVWVLDKNPLFEDALRIPPSGALDQNVVTGAAQWSGDVLGQPVQDRYFFDLPDEDFLYPGDELRYYFRATDSDGRITTLPSDVGGFVDGEGYDPLFVVRGLPTIFDVSGAQPTKLLWDDSGLSEEQVAYRRALAELGFLDNEDYDLYTSLSPERSISNGLGSAGGHGATADQLAGYDTIVYLGGSRDFALLSDGTTFGPNNDRSDDLGVLSAWHELTGARVGVHFAGHLASHLGDFHNGPAGQTYLQSILGSEVLDSDVSVQLDGQDSPVVQPVDVGFATSFVAYGGCSALERFDRVRPLSGATRGHGFAQTQGGVYPDVAASVIHDRTVDGDRKLDLSLPFPLYAVRTPLSKEDVGTTARTELLREIFDYAGVASSGGGLTPVPPGTRQITMAVHPNPFNPATTVRFTNLPQGAEGSVRVFNLRGELVRELHDGAFGDRLEFAWDGTDANGVSVASGVYLIRGQADDFDRVIKVALVK